MADRRVSPEVRSLPQFAITRSARSLPDDRLLTILLGHHGNSKLDLKQE